VTARSKTFVFDRIDVWHDKYQCNKEELPDAEGEYVRAQDAIDRAATLGASIELLETQNRELRTKCDRRGRDLAVLLRRMEAKYPDALLDDIERVVAPADLAQRLNMQACIKQVRHMKESDAIDYMLEKGWRV
jgi:hypothetical protein